MSDIPGNQHVLERLRELLDSGQAIALVGAGASAGLYPLWSELIRRLAEESVTRGLAKEEDRDFWLKKDATIRYRGLQGLPGPPG